MKPILFAGAITGQPLLGNSSNAKEMHEKNQIVLKKHQEFEVKYKSIVDQKLLTQNIEQNLSKLEIPVLLYVWDNYYTLLSEYKYQDVYEYQDKIFIIDDKNNRKINSYKKQDFWLKNLKQIKNFKYVSKINSSALIENLHPNWINGHSGQDVNLKNIAEILLPSSYSLFSPNKTRIVLKNDFLHATKIDWYAGYWDAGEQNPTNNFLSKMVYGKVKHNPQYWTDVFPNVVIHDRKKQHDCRHIISQTQKHFETNKTVEAGFDAVCAYTHFKKYSKMTFSDDKRRYTPGYAAINYHIDKYWQNYFYYYLLGFPNSNPNTFQFLNENNHEKNLWHVNYDQIFSPKLENYDEDEGVLKIKINLNHKKISEIDNFLKVGSELKFKFQFLLNNQTKIIDFDLKDVLKNKVFSIEYKNNRHAIFITEPKVRVLTNNQNVVLMDESDQNFVYDVDESWFVKDISVYDKLILKIDENNKFFYSELADRKKIKNYFFFSQKNDPTTLQSLDNSYLELMNIRVVGSDINSTAKVKFFNFLDKVEQEIEINNLLTIPSFANNFIYVNDLDIDERDLIKSKYNKSVNQYFWDNVEISKMETNVFDGTTTYLINVAENKKNVLKDWMNFLKNKKIIFFNSKSKYIEETQYQLFIDKHVNTVDLEKNFSLTELAKNKGIVFEDFIFEKIIENDEFIAIMVKINKRKNNEDYFGNKLYKFNKKSLIFDEPINPTSSLPKSSENDFSLQSQTELELKKDKKLLYPMFLSLGSIGSIAAISVGWQWYSYIRSKKIF